jgi:hypothetical protein
LAESCRGPSPTWFEGPRVLAHARPDGTFSVDDEVAREYVLRQCIDARTGRPLTLGSRLAEEVLEIGCARFLGTDADTMLAQLRRVHGADDDCRPMASWEPMATADPPFTLAGCVAQ